MRTSRKIPRYTSLTGLVFLMVLNMFGAITIVPTFYSILRPKVATALLTDEQRESLRIQKERERKLGLRDD